MSTAVPQVQPQAALVNTALEGDPPQAFESQPQAATSQPQADTDVHQESGKVHTPRGISAATPAIGGNLGYLNPILNSAARQMRHMVAGMNDMELLQWGANQAAAQQLAPPTRAADQGLPQAAVQVVAHVPEEPADVPEEQVAANAQEPADVPGPAMPFVITPGPAAGRCCQSDLGAIDDEPDFGGIRVP